MHTRKAICGVLSGILLWLLLISAVSICAADAPSDQLIIYPVTEDMPRNADFTVKVRNPGEQWQDLATYGVKVAEVVDTRTMPQDTSMAFFDFCGTVDVSITYNRGNIASARIRPLSYGIKGEVNGNTISFSLSQPRNLSVEVNGDIFHNLQLFANPVETTRPDATDPNVIYYAPGSHQVGTVNVPSGKTVYIAAGALVQGNFQINNVENVRILGRGILSGYGTRNKAILMQSAKNVELEGIIVVPAAYTVQMGNSQNIGIKNIKSFSAGGNNDGIDVFCSSDVTIEGVFMRNSDDCIAIYGHRWNYYGDVKNVIVKNSTLWADVAHPIIVGTHGDTQNPDTLDGLQFINLDILDHHEAQVDYQGCMSLDAGDSNLIRNVLFENVRVEDFREGQLVNLRVMFNRKYNTSPGRGIENVLFKDITYNGTHANLSVIAGYDDTRNIKNVVFENLKINGRVISDDMPGKPTWYKTGDMARFLVGEHVEGLVFRASAAGPQARP
ncbi:MAG: glycosyl hydrolase family 28 protein [Thermoguttaceae bacterium]